MTGARHVGQPLFEIIFSDDERRKRRQRKARRWVEHNEAPRMARRRELYAGALVPEVRHAERRRTDAIRRNGTRRSAALHSTGRGGSRLHTAIRLL